MTWRRAMPWAAVAVVAAFCGLVLSQFGLGQERASDAELWMRAAASLGARNVVSAIILGVRLLDTLVEVIVFTVAVLGVRYFLKIQEESTKAGEEIPESPLVAASSAILLPGILMLGAYVTVCGHLSPGGGFSGGAIAASALLLAAASLGAERVSARFAESRFERVEWGALAILLLVTLAPALLGRAVTTDLLPAGVRGNLASGGTILPYNVLISVKVFLGSWVIVHHFLRHRGEI
ncbi:MAG: MnhB domain-containing protein [Candidatus Bipolaricaulota bacterium]